MRIIGTLEQPPRIRLIACRNGPDAVAFAKRQLPFGRLMVLAAAQPAGQRRLQLGPPDQFAGRCGENRLRRTETLQQMDRRTAPQLGQRSSRNPDETSELQATLQRSATATG